MSDMSLWGTVIVAVVISLLAIYFTVSPLLKAGRATPLVEDDKWVELLGRKDAILQSIKDLEFDYRVGKMSQEDYERIDQRLRRQAIGLIQQIEKLAPASASLDDELESIIAQFRQTTAAPATAIAAPATVSSAVERTPLKAPALKASSPARTVAEATRFCTECGKPVDAGHKFCAYCGTPIAQPDKAAQA